MTASLGKTDWDVIVVGGGNAAICAAITAAEARASVLLLECAPKSLRGGNSRHTRNIRCMHKGAAHPLEGAYAEQEFMDDLLQVSDNNTDVRLARMVIHNSQECLTWMKLRGVHFQSALTGTLSLNRTNAFFLGGGKALLNAYYRRAESLGVTVAYDCEVTEVQISQRKFTAVSGTRNGVEFHCSGHAVVLASGGFQADLDWLESEWGSAARNFWVRGTPFNKGRVLRNMIDQDAMTVGDPTQCHSVAIDGNAPRFDGGIVSRVDCIPFSVTVNRNARRFYDEGEDLWPKRYAIWGRLVAAQPDQQAFAIIDSKSDGLFMPSAFRPTQANSIEELGNALGLPTSALKRTIDRFNASCPNGEFRPTEKDGLATRGITPAKSNWARRIEEPPFQAYALRPGITFTYMGLQVDDRARVQTNKGNAYDNIWAAGEIMAGSVLRQGYLAGFGMTIGTVFGRIAGKEAAAYV